MQETIVFNDIYKSNYFSSISIEKVLQKKYHVKETFYNLFSHEPLAWH